MFIEHELVLIDYVKLALADGQVSGSSDSLGVGVGVGFGFGGGGWLDVGNVAVGFRSDF